MAINFYIISFTVPLFLVALCQGTPFPHLSPERRRKVKKKRRKLFTTHYSRRKAFRLLWQLTFDSVNMNSKLGNSMKSIGQVIALESVYVRPTCVRCAWTLSDDAIWARWRIFFAMGVHKWLQNLFNERSEQSRTKYWLDSLTLDSDDFNSEAKLSQIHYTAK